MAIAQRPVLARVGFHFGTVQTDAAHLQQLQRSRHLQDLHEQRRDLLQEALAKVRNRVVVRVRIGGDETKRNRVVGGPLNATTRELARRVTIEQQRQQHRRRVRRFASTGKAYLQRAQIQLLHRIHHEARQMVLRQPVLHRRRQQVKGVSINLHESTHRSPYAHALLRRTDFTDRPRHLPGRIR